ncbi:MAG: hypothetical protein ABSG59_20040 [Verrucomicrobiota bacterium]
MICVRNELVIKKDRVAALPGQFLKRQCNQISEPTFGQRVLIGKKPVVGIETDFRTGFHRLSEDVRAQLARQRSGNGLFKEKPDMAAVTRA